MKKNAALSVLLFLLLAMLSNWPASASTAYDGMETQYPVVDFAPEKPGEPALYDDAIARVYVRFDDQRRSPYTTGQIQAFLRRGIEVALSLNSDTMGSSNACGGGECMTWEDVRDLQAFARSHGTTLHIIQHTNGNFETPFALTHDEIVAELDVTEIFNETGYRVRFLAIPGDTGRSQFWKRNRQYMTDVMDSLGIWYTDYNGGLNSTTGDSTSYVSIFPSVADLDNYASQRANFKSTDMSWQRPGMDIPRNELSSSTLDLGSLVVERVASWPSQYDSASHFTPNSHYLYGSWNITGVEPPRRVKGWTLTGNGADAKASGIYRRTWANFYSSALASNRGFAVVLHDSAGTFAGDPITGISNAEYVAGGAMSPEHIAWTLAMLEKNGHIKLVGPEEFGRWATGDYAKYTDLIDNERCLIPQFDIGDTLGATSEYAYIRGLGTVNTNTTNHTNSSGSQIGFLQVEQTGNVAKYARRVAATTADNPYYAVGDSVTGTRGRKGGIQLYADAANTSPSRLRVVIGNLKPGGKYQYSMDVYTPSTVNPQIEEFHQVWMGKFSKLVAGIAAGYAPAVRDTVISWQWRDADVALNPPNIADASWSSFVVPLYFPENMMGATAAGADYGSVAEATGTRLYKPFATGAGAASEGILVDGKWAWSMIFNGLGAVKISNPRLIYLGQQ